jgi:hypothetical protein
MRRKLEEFDFKLLGRAVRQSFRRNTCLCVLDADVRDSPSTHLRQHLEEPGNEWGVEVVPSGPTGSFTRL